MAEEAVNSTSSQDPENGSPSPGLEKGTYEILRARLQTQAEDLQQRLQQLNQLRGDVFGSIPTELLSTIRITTEHNCVPRDIAAVGSQLLFGYNVQMGLKSETHVEDVFSVYQFEGDSVSQQALGFLENTQFQHDFKQLYKYYKGTRFSKFQRIGPHLYFVFQVGDDEKNLKSFKWLIQGDQLSYLDNRSDHEVSFPAQHEFRWTRTHRDLHRAGKHPHISIDDRVFVETVGGDLTIKIEDNTEDGAGIYSEPVDDPDQTLDDAEVFYAILGNLILLKMKPFREDRYRYLVFNEKTSQAMRLDSLKDACVLLPEDHGLIFSNGYYLQTGQYKTFETGLQNLIFAKQMPSSNGEDYLYVFYNRSSGAYLLLTYNMISQQVSTPTACHGYCYFDDGKMLLFRGDDQPQKHHSLQVWQTPFLKEGLGIEQQNNDAYLFKVGNREVVRAMAECHEVLNLIQKDDSYSGLYVDLVKKSTDLLDTFYWLNREDTFHLDQPLKEIRNVSTTAIEEFEKVTATRKDTRNQLRKVQQDVEQLISQITRSRFQSIDEFVQLLAQLRSARGAVISLRDLKYVDNDAVDRLEKQVKENTDRLSQRSVEFLLGDDALRPYHERVDQQTAHIEQLEKVSEAKQLEAEIDQTSKDLELLIEIVSNLKIDDATQRTKIIDNISVIYSQLNQTRAKLKSRAKELLGTEGKAEFHSQLKLLGQAVVNYLDVCDTPQKCDDYLTRMMVQLEELEGRFAEFDEFVVQLAEKREEIYAAFESRKLQLQEAHNRRATALMSAAERILGGIRSRVSRLTKIDEINSYFAGDLMIEKVRDIVSQLEQLDDSVKVDDIQSRLKTIREDAVRQLKDRQELFVDGSNVIQLGKHRFTTNVQELDLTTVTKDGSLYYHLTGTNYLQPVPESDLVYDAQLAKQEVVSENEHVYRAEFLAFQIYDSIRKSTQQLEAWSGRTESELLHDVQQFMAPRYQENYIKGVHDHDAAKILRVLLDKHQLLGDLRTSPKVRNLAMRYWTQPEFEALSRDNLKFQFQAIHLVRKLFPESEVNRPLLEQLQASILAYCQSSNFPDHTLAGRAAVFLYDQLTLHGGFVCSSEARHLLQRFDQYLEKTSAQDHFEESLNKVTAPDQRLPLLLQWLSAFHQEELSHPATTLTVTDTGVHLTDQDADPADATPTDGVENSATGENETDDGPASHRSQPSDALLVEAALIRLLGDEILKDQSSNPSMELTGMLGNHAMIDQTHYHFHFFDFVDRLHHYCDNTLPAYQGFVQKKKDLLERKRRQLKLEQFQPRVLTSFVRNRLINDVYLPLIGDNLAKQMGAVGDQKRTDLMGLLLLISPPGYGKTTLMEYVANRLGITFMKINGPAIGHHVTSLDPAEAPNASARQEVEKLNLALEMGDNVMIYLDDIQHCNPEFLQKFISLCDGQRKIEGVFQGETRTYDLRGRKVCVVMAGNPYTESGDKFQIPDMLANRADTYNLGDVIGETARAFEMSYLENCLTSNATLNVLQSRSQKDVYAIIEMASNPNAAAQSLEGSYSAGQINEMVDVMRKLLRVRDVLLKVNALYIESAAQADEYRTEPSFKLQGSYRDMNKIAERVVPVMNQQELDTLIFSHFENQAQTLTSGAEANLLKFKELTDKMSPEEKQRWDDIKHTYKKNLMLGAAGQSDDKVSQVIAQLSTFSEGLYEIRSAVNRGVQQLVDSASDPSRTAMQDLTIQQIGTAIEQLSSFKLALDGIQQALLQQAQAQQSEASKPNKIHISNKIPSTFMQVIAGQFQVLEAWMEPILELAQSTESGKDLHRVARATRKHYEKILNTATDETDAETLEATEDSQENSAEDET